MEKLMIDSDVIINWLVKEVEKSTRYNMWIAPTSILELGEKRQLANHVSLLSVFEIRFVLRRKKRWNFTEIEKDLNALGNIVSIVTPSKDELIQANQLQSEQPLDPFDSVLLSHAISLEGILISRDSRFLRIASRYVPCYTPEDYIESCLNT